MAALAKQRDEVAHIVRLLQRLQYSGVECVEEAWLRRLLLQPGESRDHLLHWLLYCLLPGDGGEREAAGLLQSLSSLGLCRVTDTEVVEGRAPASQQLRFWRLLVETVSNTRHLQRLNNDAALSLRTDQLLHTLCQSPAIRGITRGEGGSVLPGDLQERYRGWCRQGKQQPVPDALQQTQQQLLHTRGQYDELSEAYKHVPSDSSYQAAQEQLSCSLSKLNESGRLFGQVYTTHLSTWITEDDQRPDLPETGAVVSRAHAALKKLNEVLSSTEELSEKTDQLRAAELVIQQSLDQHSTVTATVQRLAAN